MSISTQLIHIDNRCVIADDNNSEIPKWPVQDQGAHWHYSKFTGQRIAYNRTHVSFGFEARRMSVDEVATLNMSDLPSDVEVIGDVFYKAVS